MRTSDPRLNRRQLFVDKDVQGVLLARVGVYWACCLITVILILLCWRVVVGPSSELHVHLDYLWYHYRPILLAAFILLPILLADTLRLSNRFAGPMVRLKRGLSELADGRTDVSPIHFRSGDFWHDFAREFNRAAQRVQHCHSDAEDPARNSEAVEDSTRDYSSRTGEQPVLAATRME